MIAKSKSNKMLGKEYNCTSNGMSSEDNLCENTLSKFLKSIYTDWENEYKTGLYSAENLKCMIVRLQELNVADVMMQILLYQTTRGMPKRKQKEAVKSVEIIFERKVALATKLCFSSNVFGEMFDELCNDKARKILDRDDDNKSANKSYCTTKYMKDNSFVNITIYNITVNPKNVLSKSECDEIVKKSMKEVRTQAKQQFEEELMPS